MNKNANFSDVLDAITYGTTGSHADKDQNATLKGLAMMYGMSANELRDKVASGEISATDIAGKAGIFDSEDSTSRFGRSLGVATGQRAGYIQEESDGYYAGNTKVAGKWSDPAVDNKSIWIGMPDTKEWSPLYGGGVLPQYTPSMPMDYIHGRLPTLIEIDYDKRIVSVNEKTDPLQTYELRLHMQSDDINKMVPALALGMLATVAMPEVAPAIATSVAKFAGLTTELGSAVAEYGTMSALNGGVGFLSNGITNKMNKDSFTDNGLSAFTFGAVTGLATTYTGQIAGLGRYPATFGSIFAGDIAQTAWNSDKSIFDLNSTDYFKASTSAILGTKVLWMTGSVATKGIPWTQTGFASTTISLPLTVGNDCIWNRYRNTK